MKNFILKYLPPILWASLIFYLSNIPKLEVTSEPVGNFITRKFAHIAEYGILGILVFRALNWKKPLLAILICILYAITDEIHQSFVPLRTGKFTDILFDSLGTSLGVYGSYIYLNRRNKKISSGNSHKT